MARPSLGEFEVGSKSARPSLGEFEVTSGGANPGDSPDNPIPQQHPDVGWWNRTKAMNFTTDSAQAADYFTKQGFEAVDQGDYNITLRRPGGKWYVLDPAGLGLSDVTDVGKDIVSGVAMAGGAALGALGGSPGGPVGAGVGAAFGSGAAAGGVELGAQQIGKALGTIPEETPTDWGNVGKEAAFGAAAEGALRVAKPVLKKVTGLLKFPAKVEGALSGQTAKDAMKAERIAARVGYNEARLAEFPVDVAEKTTLANLRDVTVRKAMEAEERAAARPGVKATVEMAKPEFPSAVGAVADKPAEFIERDLLGMPGMALKKAGDFSGPQEVFQKVLQVNELHPTSIFARVLYNWPDALESMSRAYKIPFDALVSLQGASQRLREREFLNLFDRIGSSEFENRTRNWAKEMASLVKADEFVVLDKASREAMERVSKGSANREDFATLVDLILPAMANHARDPEIKAAFLAYRKAQAKATHGRARKLAAQGVKTSTLNRIDKEAMEKGLTSRMEPYYGHKAVETATKAFAIPGHLLDWMSSGVTPPTMKRSFEILPPYLQKPLLSIRSVWRKTPEKGRALLYTLSKNPDFRRAFEE